MVEQIWLGSRPGCGTREQRENYVWASVGLAYGSFLAVLFCLHKYMPSDPHLAAQYAAQVSPIAYFTPALAFGTALLLNLLTLAVERSSVKMRMSLLVVYINLVAVTAQIMNYLGILVLRDPWGQGVVIVRMVMWLWATPAMIYLLGLISDMSQKEVLEIVGLDIGMLVTAFFAVLQPSPSVGVFWVAVSTVLYVYSIRGVWRMFQAPIDNAGRGTSSVSLKVVRRFTVVTWSGFVVLFMVTKMRLIDLATEEWLWGLLDFLGKVMFSSSLLQSNFITMEERRLNAMKLVEEGRRDQVIKELTSLISQKEQFMSSMSHELRTPINGIIGLSDALIIGCCGELTEVSHRTVNTIKSSGLRLLKLVNDILDAANMQHGKLVIRQERVKLDRLVDDVMDLLKPTAKKDVRLLNEVPRSMPAILGDTGRVMQIMHNLIGNACKFTPVGGTIAVRAILKMDEIEVAVSDTGRGIPRDKLSDIFQAFCQLEPSTHSGYNGPGLGLTLVKQLVAAHGGTITVKSKVNVGTTFFLTFQVWDPAVHAEEAARTMTPSDIEATKQRVSRMMSILNLRIGRAGDIAIKEKEKEKESAAAQEGPETPKAPSERGEPRKCRSQSSILPTNTRFAAPALQDARPRPELFTRPEFSTRMSWSPAAMQTPSAPKASRGPRGHASPALGGDSPAAAWERVAGDRVQFPKEALADIASIDDDAEHKQAQMQHDTGPTANVDSGRLPRMARTSEQRKAAEEGAAAAAAVAAAVAEGVGAAEAAGAAAAVAAGDFVCNLPPSTRGMTGVEGGSHSPAVEKQVHVLSVVADEENQVELEGWLKAEGFQVTRAMSASEALDALRDTAPDIIVLDLPGRAGYEVCCALQELHPSLCVPVIMVGAKDKEEDVVQGLAVGASDYVRRPFGRPEMLARIQAHMRFRTRVARLASEHTGTDSDDKSRRLSEHLVDMLCAPSKAFSLPPSIKSKVENSAGVSAPLQVFDDLTMAVIGVTNLDALILSRSTPVPELLGGLASLFICLEDLLIKYNAYLVDCMEDKLVIVTGLSGDQLHDQACNAVELCVELQRLAHTLIPGSGAGRLMLSAGIHCCTATASIVGVQHPVLQVTGALAEKATQLQATCPSDCVHVSKRVFELCDRPELFSVAVLMQTRQADATYLHHSGPWSVHLPSMPTRFEKYMSAHAFGPIQSGALRLRPVQRALLHLIQADGSRRLVEIISAEAMGDRYASSRSRRSLSASRREGSSCLSDIDEMDRDSATASKSGPESLKLVTKLQLDKEELLRQLEYKNTETERLQVVIDNMQLDLYGLQALQSKLDLSAEQLVSFKSQVAALQQQMIDMQSNVRRSGEEPGRLPALSSATLSPAPLRSPQGASTMQDVSSQARTDDASTWLPRYNTGFDPSRDGLFGDTNVLPSIAEFLASIGMPHLAPAFVREEITLDMIPFIHDSTLLQLGVASVGDLVRLRRLANVS